MARSYPGSGITTLLVIVGYLGMLGGIVILFMGFFEDENNTWIFGISSIISSLIFLGLSAILDNLHALRDKLEENDEEADTIDPNEMPGSYP